MLDELEHIKFIFKAAAQIQNPTPTTTATMVDIPDRFDKYIGWSFSGFCYGSMTAAGLRICTQSGTKLPDRCRWCTQLQEEYRLSTAPRRKNQALRDYLGQAIHGIEEHLPKQARPDPKPKPETRTKHLAQKKKRSRKAGFCCFGS